MAIRVLVGEDDYLVREGIERILATQGDIELLASYEDYESLVDAVKEHQPDVVITDIRMPPTQTDEGIRLASQLNTAHPEIGVVVLSQYDEPEYVLALLEEGPAGRSYLLKETVSNVVQLADAIRTVAAGGSVIDPEVVGRLVQARSKQSSPLRWITPREQEVLEEMASGASNATIATELGISIRSVEKHINSIFAKLGLSEETGTHRRVRAVLTFLSETE